MNWRPREIEPPRGEAVHVWRGSLDLEQSEVSQLSRFLEADERQRAGRFHFPIHRARFIAARGLLRSILAEYLKCEPEEIAFEYSFYGKPFLKNHPLHFNLAHSEDRFILAACETPVGVDLELRRAIPELDLLALQVFSEAELERWKTASSLESFLSLWTRKEALLKGIGLGIANHVKEVSVFFQNHAEVNLPETLTSTAWSICTVMEQKEIWSLATPFNKPQLLSVVQAVGAGVFLPAINMT